jgi:valyl-tRNA synthetase
MGMDVKEARKAIISDLDLAGFLVKTEDHMHNVGHCYKCDTVIQPLLKEQWFINMESLAARAINELKANKIAFYPETKKTQLITYLEGLKDWNISRQIAWGIPIPAFQNVDNPDDWIYDERVNEEILTIDSKTYRRDPDVFDTWFSSSSWPYATLDFPDGDDFNKHYPLGLMETGGEILYPWVSRMIMLGLYVTDEVPFKAVYVHGYVMAEDGSKMSKSIGNVVDPLPIIDEFGSDALRMGVVWGRSPAVNRGYDQRRVEEARNFCNKVWNIARYIENITEGDSTSIDAKAITGVDNWILSKLSNCLVNMLRELDNYAFSEAFETLYHFIWDDLADWYIEASKADPNKPLLNYLLESTLIMMHPFAPFVTETIWQTMKDESDNSLLATKTFNTVLHFDKASAKDFEEVKNLVTEIRSIQKTLKTSGVILIHDHESLIENDTELVKQLSGVREVRQGSEGGLKLTNPKYSCWLDIEEEVAANYIGELEAKQVQQSDLIAQLEKRLSNKAYVNNAPEAVVSQTKSQLDEANLQLEVIATEIKQFKG